MSFVWDHSTSFHMCVAIFVVSRWVLFCCDLSKTSFVCWFCWCKHCWTPCNNEPTKMQPRQLFHTLSVLDQLFLILVFAWFPMSCFILTVDPFVVRVPSRNKSLLACYQVPMSCNVKWCIITAIITMASANAHSTDEDCLYVEAIPVRVL